MVGYDDNPGSRFYNPPLTTVHQERFRIGAEAAGLLLRALAAARPRHAPRVDRSTDDHEVEALDAAHELGDEFGK